MFSPVRITCKASFFCVRKFFTVSVDSRWKLNADAISSRMTMSYFVRFNSSSIKRQPASTISRCGPMSSPSWIKPFPKGYISMFLRREGHTSCSPDTLLCFKNCIMRVFMPFPQARRAVPSAAVVFPFPSPV